MAAGSGRPAVGMQREIFRALILLTLIMTAVLTVASVIVNVHAESVRLDENLQNMAQAVAGSQPVRDSLSSPGGDAEILSAYLDSLKSSLSNIDVISVIGTDNVRRYHSNKALIGQVYDGTLPDFSAGADTYSTSDTGPSGPQRRAYAAVYDDAGRYCGFVLAIMLRQNINRIILSAVAVHLLCAAVIVLCAVAISARLSRRIKGRLMGYEPDTLSAMFSVRDDVLEALEEGIVAVDEALCPVYMNSAAVRMLSGEAEQEIRSAAGFRKLYPTAMLSRVLNSAVREMSVPISAPGQSDILANHIPIVKNGRAVGVLCILHDRSEYTKLMEDLSGVKYMVESMRANNHDFINKLHVILGLIQMGRGSEACEYITNINTVQQNVIHTVMSSIDDPSVSALLIGKYSRAAELNIRFALDSGSRLSREDISVPSGDLVTMIGNLIENAMDAMNSSSQPDKELTVGIFTSPHAMLIRVDDTGPGIDPAIGESIFQNGFSTKGSGRGTGLYAVKSLAEKYGGSITFESEPGVGTSFTLTLTDRGGMGHV